MIGFRWPDGVVKCPTCGSEKVSFIKSRRPWECSDSSYELGRSIAVTQKSVWFMLHRIRLAMQDEDGGKLGGHVGVDETSSALAAGTCTRINAAAWACPRGAAS
jgi:hypothetical protein